MTIQDIGGLIAIVAFVSAILGWAFKHWVLDIMSERIEQRIDERTYPIQSDANGGSSLPDAIKLMREFKDDVNHRFDKIETRQIQIGDTTVAANAMLTSHLDWHNAQK